MNKYILSTLFVTGCLAFGSTQAQTAASLPPVSVYWTDEEGNVTRRENALLRPDAPNLDRFVFFLDGKMGLIDSSGRVVTEPLYEELWYNSGQRYSVVRRNNYSGFIDSYTGEEIASVRYSGVQPFSEDLAAVTTDDKLWGYIDTTGKMVIEPSWNYALPFKNGTAKVILHDNTWLIRGIAGMDIYPTPGRTGYIDRTGQYLIPADYSYISNNQSGERHLRFTRGEYQCDEPDGYCINPYVGSKWGLMDLTGKILIPDDEYDFLYPYYPRNQQRVTFIVEKGGQHGLLDPETLQLLLPLGSFDSPEELEQALLSQ